MTNQMKADVTDDIKKQGDIGERIFLEWLDRESIGYLYINQSQEMLSSVFAGAIKRPDFLVLLPSIGFLAVDVKHYTVSNQSFTLNVTNEICKSASFEQLTRLYMWYAYKDKDCTDDRWYFISAQKALENGQKRHNSGTGDDFLSISIEHFTVIETGDDFTKLFKARIGKLGTMSRAIEYYFKEMKV